MGYNVMFYLSFTAFVFVGLSSPTHLSGPISVTNHIFFFIVRELEFVLEAGLYFNMLPYEYLHLYDIFYGV